MQTIIVPTDFSPISHNAARYAANLARALHTTVTLFHAFPIPMAFSEIPVPPQVFIALQQDAADLIAKAKADLELACPGSVKFKTEIRPGLFMSSLRAVCEETVPYAVVMSSHGSAGIEQLLSGSNTNAAVTHLSRPLIVVPHGTKFKSPKRIALACDLENVKATVPDQIIREFVRTFEAALFVVHIHRNADLPYTESVMDGTSDLREMLKDLHPSYHFIDGKNPAESILDFVEKNEIDFLFGFPKKRGLLENILHRSQSAKLAKETLVPFLAIHH